MVGDVPATVVTVTVERWNAPAVMAEHIIASELSTEMEPHEAFTKFTLCTCTSQEPKIVMDAPNIGPAVG